jgi:hypothetical protein
MWTDTAIAVGTLGTAITTVFFYFSDRIIKWYKRPRLEIGIKQEKPDCQFQKTSVSEDKTKPCVNGYWCRLFLLNKGKSAAKGLEVAIERIEQCKKNKWKEYSFLKSNLIWTHQTHTKYKIFMPQLLPNTTKNVDFGCFTNPKDKSKESKYNIEFFLTITAKPFTKYNLIPYGKYRFTIIAGAKNCTITRKKIVVNFSNKWTDDENKIKSIIRFD